MKEDILDELLKIPRIGSVNASPDQKWVVWRWINLGAIRDLYLSPADGSSPAKKVTDFKQNTNFCSWTSDSKSIIVSHDYDGDERSRLYLIDINSLDVRPLTPEHPDYYIRGGQMHPNGEFLIYSANYDFELSKETEISFIYRHNIKTNERMILAKPEKPGYTYLEMNDSGTHILYTRNDIDPAGVQLWLVDIEKKEDKEILNFGKTAKILPAWNKNNTDILFITEEDSLKRVGMYSIVTKETKWLIDNPKRDITYTNTPYGSDDILIYENVEAEYSISLIDPISFKETLLPKTNTIQPIVPISSDVWLSRYFNSQQSDTLILWDINLNKVVREVTNVFEYTELKKDDLTKAEKYHWSSSDGLKIQGWLYVPKVEPVGTIIYVHGGPTAHSDNSFNREIQYYIARGFIVLDPNYRGSTGFGLEFQESIKIDHWGGMEQEDILSGIRSLISDGISLENKIGMTGTSYGGYSSWYGITHFPKKYLSAAAPICGMTDLIVDYETTRPDLRVYSEEMMGGSPTQVPEIYKERSPINFVSEIKGNLLIIQGARDPNVTPENVRTVEEKLKEHGKSYDKLLFDDEGHGINKPKNQKILYKKIADFFEESFK